MLHGPPMAWDLSIPCYAHAPFSDGFSDFQLVSERLFQTDGSAPKRAIVGSPCRQALIERIATLYPTVDPSTPLVAYLAPLAPDMNLTLSHWALAQR